MKIKKPATALLINIM